VHSQYGQSMTHFCQSSSLRRAKISRCTYARTKSLAKNFSQRKLKNTAADNDGSLAAAVCTVTLHYRYHRLYVLIILLLKYHMSASLAHNVEGRGGKEAGQVEGQKSCRPCVFTLATAKRHIFMPVFHKVIC
jgi:hypothetical protein